MTQRSDLTGAQLTALANVRCELRQYLPIRNENEELESFGPSDAIKALLYEEETLHLGKVQAAMAALDAALTVGGAE